MADKCDKKIENKSVSAINLSLSPRKTAKPKTYFEKYKGMKKSKKKKHENKKSSTRSGHHSRPCRDVYEIDNEENVFVIHNETRSYERVNDTDQLNLVSDLTGKVNLVERHGEEHYLNNRFVANQSVNFENRAIYNNFIHNKSGTDYEMRNVHRNFESFPNHLHQSEYFTNQVQVLYEENLRLKEKLNSVYQQWPSYSNNEVEIIFRRKDLQKKLLPVLQDIVEGLVTEKFSVENLKKFLASDCCSSPKNNIESPEGDLFSLDLSSIPDPDANTSIPKYETSFSEILQPENQKDKNQKKKITCAKSCFNCSEDHHLSECPYMIDYKRVATAKKRIKTNFSQNVRYHVHGSKESEFKPGLPSNDLREAMGLVSSQIPLYIYQMRILGYPPGWMEEAAVESSGITVYGSDGNVEADGNSEACSSEIKTQYDPDKLVDYPGFNALLPHDCVDEADKLGYPPFHYQNLRCVQESYMVKPDVRPKRKRELAENKPFKVQRCEVDMEMENNSDDEMVWKDFGRTSNFVPPLPVEPFPPPPPDDPPPPPDDLPPPPDDLPPPPDEPPPPPDDPPLLREDDSPLPPEDDALPPPPIPPPKEECEPLPPGIESPIYVESSALSFVPPRGFDLNCSDGISFGECWEDKRGKEDISVISSSSLTELEEMQKKILMELKNEMLDEDTLANDAPQDNAFEAGFSSAPKRNSAASSPPSPNEEFVTLESSSDMSIISEISVHSKDTSPLELSLPSLDGPSRSESRTSKSKFMALGTPTLSRHSSYTKLPDYEQFSKNVTSHMNFENLPNSTGTFQKLKGVLRKVKEKMKFM